MIAIYPFSLISGDREVLSDFVCEIMTFVTQPSKMYILKRVKYLLHTHTHTKTREHEHALAETRARRHSRAQLNTDAT